MLGTDDKTMEFRDTDEWSSLCHQICCLKITSKQISMSGRGRDGGGKKMREEERRVRKETAWPMQLPAANEDPGGTAGPSEGCSQDWPSDPLHPRSPL